MVETPKGAEPALSQPHPRVEDVFAGRQAELHQLAKCLFPASGKRRPVAVAEEMRQLSLRVGAENWAAVSAGSKADILQARGDLDGALKIRREEELPVYERLGDVREKAVTMGKIADSVAASGQLNDAIRIYSEDVLPAYKRIGEARMMVIDRGYLVMYLLRRNERGDRKEAGGLLRLALVDSRRMKLPEA